MPDSRLPGFHGLTMGERLGRLVEAGWLSPTQASMFHNPPKVSRLSRVSENVLGNLEYPVAVATNVVVNGVPRLVPMAIEEPSVVAACSNAGRLTQPHGGVKATRGERKILGQVLVATDWSLERLATLTEELNATFPAEANGRHARLVAGGGGLKEVTLRRLADEGGPMWLLELHCHPGDAMGANAINDMAEHLRSLLRSKGVGDVMGAIVSNHAVAGPAEAKVSLPSTALARDPDESRAVAARIVKLGRWAELDVYRRATQVKGILNGIQAVATALYLDTRAISSTLWSGLSEGDAVVRWQLRDDCLEGRLTAPMVCSTVGGTGPVMPTWRLFLDWLEVRDAGDLEEVLAAVGLLQNLAALRAIAAEGIQRGHMRLHARKNEESHE